MSNWTNCRLLVVGPKTAVIRFARMARAKPCPVFAPDMLCGEGKDLTADRMERVGPHQYQKCYQFQTADDDGIGHFQSISRIYPGINLLLVFADPNSGEVGSCFLHAGRARHYILPGKKLDVIFTLHGYDHEADDNEVEYWEALGAAMDAAQAKLAPLLARKHRSRRPQ